MHVDPVVVLIAVYVKVFVVIPVTVKFPGALKGVPVEVITKTVGAGVVVVVTTPNTFVAPNVPIYVIPW